MSPQSNQPNRATFTVDSKNNNMYEFPPVLSLIYNVVGQLMIYLI